ADFIQPPETPQAHLYIEHYLPCLFTTAAAPKSTLFPYTTLFRSSIRPLADAKGISLLCEAEPGLPDAPVDENRITQVITNLLNRSEEHTSELQSRGHLVCRLLLEKKNTETRTSPTMKSACIAPTP